MGFRCACPCPVDRGAYSTLVADHLRHLRFCSRFACCPSPPVTPAPGPVQTNEQTNVQVCVPVNFLGIGITAGLDGILAGSQNLQLDAQQRTGVVQTPLGDVHVTLVPKTGGAAS